MQCFKKYMYNYKVHQVIINYGEREEEDNKSYVIQCYLLITMTQRCKFTRDNGGFDVKF